MKISIGVKVLALLGITTFVGLGVGISSYRGTNELVSSSEWVIHTYQVISKFNEVLVNMNAAESSQRGYVVTGEPSYLEPYNKGKVKADEAFAALRKITSDNVRQQARLDELRKHLDEKFAIIDKTIKLRQDGFDQAKKFVVTDAGRIAMEKIRETVDQGVAEEQNLLTKRASENAAYIDSARAVLFGGGFVFLLIFGLATLFVRRGIIQPLFQVMTLANGIASGNLKQEPLKATSHDEIGELATIFNNMLAFLRSMATQNLEVSRNLGTAASEILAAIQQQAAAVREQATAIQQTTTTMEEIGQSGAQVTERGRQISNSAENTLDAANAGIGAVQGTNATMISIRSQVESVAENIVNLSERNQTIGELISSVNDIAEQSNLLALNAAIEAADAGEHGRRFSVVANELKNLSEQAKNSTVQVRLILGQIQKGINTSVMLTEEAVKRAEGGKIQADIAEKTILQLTGTTNESVKTFQQIMGATNQQQIGFEQITQALKSIRVGAEQTAASTSQLEKAAMSLNTLGEQLQVSALRYKI